MFRFKCPQCSAENNLMTVLWRHLRHGDGRRCGSCGVKLEIENASLISILIGLLGGGLVVGLKGLGIRGSADQLVVTVVVMWLAALVLTALIARWKVKSEVEIDSPELRKWSKVLNVSITLGLVVVILTNAFVAIELKRLQVLSSSAHSTAAIESINRDIDLLLNLPLISFGVFALTIAVDIYAGLRRKKIRLLLLADNNTGNL